VPLIAGVGGPPADAGDGSAGLAEPAARADAESCEVGLDELLAFAERNAPALQVATRRRGYGEAAREGASPLLPYNPAVQFAIGPRIEGSEARDFDFTTSLGQPVEIAGQRGLRLDAADRLSDRLDAELGVTRWDVRRQVILGYRTAVVARERVRISDRLVSFADDLLRIAQRRLAAGEGSAIDVRIAETDAAQARQAKILAERDLRSLQLSLCEITGWPIESPPLPRAGLDPPRPVPALRAVLALAGERHPELRSRRAATAEAHARAELADREAWPTPIFGVSVAREGRGATATESTSYIVLGTVGLPLPFWQLNQGERARAHVDVEVARTEESTTARTLRARIARAHSALRAAAERVQVFTSAVTPSLEDSLALLRRGLDAGEISLLDVAVARERFLQTQRDALSAYEDYYRALVELEYVVGAELEAMVGAELTRASDRRTP
jgi:cobalt-zinc-cadmium efflux system outer membrane protein